MDSTTPLPKFSIPKNLGLGFILTIGIILFPVSPALALSIEFFGSGTGVDNASLSSSALFIITNDILTITLTNTATSDNTNSNKDVPGNTLTGVKFDWTDNLPLNPETATISPGAIIQGNTCTIGPCNGATTNVGGEFAFNTSIGGFEYAISSAGWIGTSSGNFNGPNLDGTNAPGGINFGIISNDPSFLPNGGLASDPLIRNSVVFTLSGATGLSVLDISNVTFQYGTSLTEPMFTQTDEKVVPEPSTILLFGTGLAGLLAMRWRRSRSEMK